MTFESHQVMRIAIGLWHVRVDDGTQGVLMPADRVIEIREMLQEFAQQLMSQEDKMRSYPTRSDVMRHFEQNESDMFDAWSHWKQTHIRSVTDVNDTAIAVVNACYASFKQAWMVNGRYAAIDAASKKLKELVS